MNISPQTVRRDFSRVAATYDRHAALQRAVLRQLVALGRDPIPPGAAVLDAGCGTGYLARHLREQGLDWRLTQCDLAEGMCQHAASHAPTLCADLTALPLAGSCMDAVVSSLCLQWVEDGPSALAEIHRVLRPGGIALLSTFGPETLGELREAYGTLGEEVPVHVFAGVESWSDAARHAGFTLLKQEVTREVQYFDTLAALLRQLKGLGATYKLRRTAHGLTGAGIFTRLARAYPQQTHHGKPRLPVTFEVYYLVLRKG